MRVRNRFGILAAAAILPLTAACGSSSTDAASSSTETASDTASASASESMAPSESMSSSAPMTDKDIVQTAVSAGTFTTLVTALKAAKLDTTLSGKGPFTVFAPTDAAFKKLPAGTLDKLLKDPTGDLASILKYHVVPGKVMASQVVTMNGKKVETVNGESLTVMVEGSKVMLKDAKGGTVNVTKTDVAASNGVINVIDGVLMP